MRCRSCAVGPPNCVRPTRTVRLPPRGNGTTRAPVHGVGSAHPSATGQNCLRANLRSHALRVPGVVPGRIGPRRKPDHVVGVGRSRRGRRRAGRRRRTLHRSCVRPRRLRRRSGLARSQRSHRPSPTVTQTAGPSNPEAGEALYDIDRSVVVALFRPPRALQHLHSIRGLPGRRDLERLRGRRTFPWTRKRSDAEYVGHSSSARSYWPVNSISTN